MEEKTGKAGRGIVRNLAVMIICAAIAAGLLLIPGPAQTAEKLQLTDSAAVNYLCELATLRCFYHDVGEFEYRLEGVSKILSDIALWPFNELIRPGYKRLWVEYDGIVEYGIDTKTDVIQVNDPDEHGVVEIYLPEAKVLSVDAADDTFAIYEDTGFLVSITAEEQTKVFAETQRNMKEKASQDQAMLRRARSNARAILEEYVTKVGKGLGTEYRVRWLEQPR
ncbi:MAG: DUF4230 domain-containing protein [Clostridia bacterium]|nr:DUF4230 domain-containing protein [Clostridia bacterium]